MRTTGETIPAARIFLGNIPPMLRPFILQMGILFLATFASEDLACISAGVLIAQGRLTYLKGVGAFFLGILAGDLCAFAAGRIFGNRRLYSKWLSRWMAPE